MKHFKRFAALLLGVAMIMTIGGGALAAEGEPPVEDVLCAVCAQEPCVCPPLPDGAEDGGTDEDMLSNETPLAEPSYTFFIANSNPPAAIASLTIDDKGPRELSIGVVKPDGNGGSPETLDLTKFSQSTEGLLKPVLRGDDKKVELIPKKNGSTKLSYTNGSIIASIAITVSGFTEDVPPAKHTELSVPDDAGNPTGSFSIPSTQLGSSEMRPFPFVISEVDASTETVTKTKITPADMTVTFQQIAGDTVTDIGEIFWRGADEKGNPALFTKALAVGKFEATVSFTSPIAAENTENGKHELKVIYEVRQPVGENIITVPNETYKTIQAAIEAAPPTTAESITIIKVKDGTYAENLTLDKWILVESESGKPADVIIDGTVTFAATKEPQGGDGSLLRAQIAKMTLKGNGSGTGVQTDGGYGKFADMVFDDFAVGAAVTPSMKTSGSVFKNCTIGMVLNYPKLPGRVTFRGYEFQDNGTAIQVLGARETYTIAMLSCNFTNNDINVGNQTGTPVNFAYNYYGGYEDSFNYDRDLSGKFTGAVVYAPYYRDPVTKGDNGSLTQPAKAYIDPLTFAGLEIEAANANKPIDTANFTDEVKMSLADVGTDGAGRTIAGWDFTAANPALAAAFNPAIATKLESGSSGAVATLPNGAQYQPVSFRHSGALPGTAEVSVVKTADAPTANLKLYKITGSTLTLQPDAVTFENDTYKFNRDNASDYVITDAVVTTAGGGNPGSDNGNSGDSNTSNDYISAKEIKDKLENSTGSTISVSVAGKSLVSASVFDALKNSPGKTLTLKGDGYSWSFKGTDIKNTISRQTYFDSRISGTSPNAAEITQATGGAEIINVYFSYHGQLPGMATIDLAVDSKYNGKTLNFYYYNAATKQVETIATGILVINGKVPVSITHCSDFILTPAVLNAAAASTEAPAEKRIPSTGR